MTRAPCGASANAPRATGTWQNRMAIYHLSIKPISRSSGRSATGAAAYRAGEKVVDSRTGEIHDYTRKRGVIASEIVLPDSAGWTPTRSELWNAAEQAEKRKDACVAREHEVAIPAELTPEQQRDLIHAYCRNLANRHGCAVDYAIHEPGKGGDNRNVHAHILCTTRQVDGQGLGQKCEREQAGRKRKDDMAVERKVWADFGNRALARAGRPERISHKTLDAQGIDRKPTSHKGPAVTAIERKGKPSRVAKRMEFEQAKDVVDAMIVGMQAQVDQVGQALDQAEARRADLERQQKVNSQREQKRGAWEAKHYTAPGVSLRRSPPTAGKRPAVWRTLGPEAIPLVVDYGDRLKPTGKPENAAKKAAALVSVAVQKGWPAITVHGPAEFQLAVARAAMAQGVALADQDLARKAQEAIQREQEVAAQRQAQEAARKAAEQARMEKQKAPAPTPSPSKPLPQPPQAAKAVPAAPAAPQGPTLAELRAELASLDKQVAAIRAEPVPRPLPTLTEEEARYEAAREANKAAGQKLHPENQYEYAHLYGKGLALHVAKQQQAEHAKTQRPLLLGKAAWDAEAQRLSDKVAELTGAVAADSFRLSRRGKQIQAARAQEIVKRDAEIKRQVESKTGRLAALAERRAGVEAQIKHPRFAEQIKQEQAKAREVLRGHSRDDGPSQGRGGWGIGD